MTRAPSCASCSGGAQSFCNSAIVRADNPDEAQGRFKEQICANPEGGNPIEMTFNKIVAPQFVDHLLTETSADPIDWPQVVKQAQEDLSTPVDDMDQGYWLDANAVLKPSFDIESLRRDLPEDIRSGLNWAEGKQFFFLISVLSPPPPPNPADEPEASPLEQIVFGSVAGPVETEADFPELVEKEAAVLIRARNSAVAVWLWRKYTVNTKLSGNQIRIDPWCGVMGLEPGSPS